MKRGLLSLVVGLFLIFSSASSHAEGPSNFHPNVDVPSDVAKAVEKSYPGAKILMASSSCKLGDAKKDSFGIVVDAGSKNHAADRNPLRALVAVKNNAGWDVSEIPRDVEYSKGSMDFLSEFWDEKGFKGPYEIRCIILPSENPAISPDANGEFIGSFAKTPNRHALHLCFTADDTYNDWVCSSISIAAPRPVISFVQMNAD